MITEIIKRDGRRAPFRIEKITDAIFAAAQASGGQDYEMAQRLARQVVQLLDNENMITIPTVEQIQDSVEDVLSKTGYADVAKAYGVEKRPCPHRQKVHPLPQRAHPRPGDEHPADEDL